MQLFYAPDLDTDTGTYLFTEEESKHCVRVLRLTEGDSLHLTDGRGLLCRAEIVEASPKHCRVEIRERWSEYGRRSYELVMAVAPTKNSDRFEWFVEKATEIGVDRIVPLLTDRCERRVLKTDRLEKVATSAMKQSLKAYHPMIDALTPFRELVAQPFGGVKLIAHCEEDMPRQYIGKLVPAASRTMVLIGPEGDFSPEEIALAHHYGFENVSLGHSRLRTETAAVTTVADVAFINESTLNN